MIARGSESVATDEATVVTKPPLDPIVVEDSQGDRGLANSSGANESNWNKFPSETDYFLDQLIASKGPRGERRGFSKYAGFKCEIMSLFAA